MTLEIYSRDYNLEVRIFWRVKYSIREISVKMNILEGGILEIGKRPFTKLPL